MKAAYSDVEIVELSMCLGSWIAFGRLNRVLGLDAECVLPASRLLGSTTRATPPASEERHVGPPAVPTAGLTPAAGLPA